MHLTKRGSIGMNFLSARRDWEALMEPARSAARRLAAQGRIVITQHNHPAALSTAKGPIRLRLR